MKYINLIVILICCIKSLGQITVNDTTFDIRVPGCYKDIYIDKNAYNNHDSLFIEILYMTSKNQVYSILENAEIKYYEISITGLIDLERKSNNKYLTEGMKHAIDVYPTDRKIYFLDITFSYNNQEYIIPHRLFILRKSD